MFIVNCEKCGVQFEALAKKRRFCAPHLREVKQNKGKPTQDKNCIDCKVLMPNAIVSRLRCNPCGKIEKMARQRRYRHSPEKKCLTCETMISRHKYHCGNALEIGSCLYKYNSYSAAQRNKKPPQEMEGSWYERVTGKKRDTACDGSGMF